MNNPLDNQTTPAIGEQENLYPPPNSGRRFRTGFWLLILIVISILVFTRIEANRILKNRIEKVRSGLQAVEPLLLVERRYPFDAQRQDEASRHYRCIDWLCSRPGSTLNITTSDLPTLEQGLWAGSGDDIQSHGKALQSLLDQTSPSRTPKQKDLDAAKAFVDAQGAMLLDILWNGVLSDHIRWPANLNDGANIEVCNLLATRNAATIALYIASLKPPKEAIEIALMVDAFGRDLGLHPTLIGLMIGSAIESQALDSLERRMTLEGEEPSPADLQRIITALGSMPTKPNHVMTFESLAFDATIVNLLIENDPLKRREFLGESFLLSMPEIIIWQWGTFSRYNKQLEPVWTLPLKQARVHEATVMGKLQDERGGGLARLAIPSYLNARINLSECHARTNLIRLGAAAKLHRIKTGRWPVKPEELSEFFAGKVPRDPLASEADFSFETSEDTWTAKALTINRPISISLPARRPEKAGD